MEHQLNTRASAPSFSFMRIAIASTYIFFSTSLISLIIFLFSVNPKYLDTVFGIVVFGGPITLLIFLTYRLPRVSSGGLALTLSALFIVFLGSLLIIMGIGFSNDPTFGGSGKNWSEAIDNVLGLAFLSFFLGSFSLFVSSGFRAKALKNRS